ncbi:uncharacterized protein LOC127374155 isoform X4 [Dicentrarchus labrax]|uniref:uncharacterized protein LOC127374155 isoform X4 n=1 Tax=Dicentrarchus labrax TaxID=13489 RepID=UPI0021F5A990|nr:uncharacterized protein LOC127374155 isoform X4 [Dicentrarchus labrax]
MGSLKDEMRGLREEDHNPCEKADDGERPGGSDGSAVPEGPQINTSQESTNQGDYQPKLHMNASYAEERDKIPISKDQVLSGGVCDTADQSDSIGGKDSTQTDAIPLMQQPEDDKTTAATHNGTTISSNKFPSDGDGDREIQGEMPKDENTSHDREKVAEIENISVPIPVTPGPFDPRSPAPVGQHHMRTQVSLEVVQCCSAATSPMTPPEGSHSFFFPSSFGRSGAVGADTKDAELQVGQQVEFCSVATSPMTPKTPSTTAFPELIGRETVQKEEKVKKSEGQRDSGQQDKKTKSPAEAELEITGAIKFTTTKELSEDFSSNTPPESSTSCPAAGLIDSQVTLEDSKQQCKQQRMGSMDQDITILVTHYDNNEDEEGESSLYPTEPEMVKIDEYEELRESNSDVMRENGKENILTETVAPHHAQDILNTNPPQNKAEESSVAAFGDVKTDVKCDNSEVKENKDACEELREVSVTKPPVPESPAPFGCHSIRTQVSLEVVQCQSVATSPMTPPEGDLAFYFPSSFGKCSAVGTETKDAELQVGQQVEFRSVATAPMTPRTPTITVFPEIRKEASIEEKIVEEDDDKKEQVVKDKKEAVKEEEKATEEKKVEAVEEKATEEKKVEEAEEKVTEEKKVEAAEEKVTEEKKVEAVEKKLTEEKKVEAVEEKVTEEKKVEAVEEKVTEEKKVEAVEEKLTEEKKVEAVEEKVTEEKKVEAVKEKVTEEKKVEASEEDTKDANNCKEKAEEPVQEVSWDEKGMTWEVYGAVVEVTVLGSAIQKHLEKQVKKRQPSMPPPPPLNPSAIPLSSESTKGGSGKGRAGKRGEQDAEVSRRRRNPFRLMMENMQQPHCCSKAHTTE